MEDWIFLPIFAPEHQNQRINMLGIKTRRAPIGGDTANQIRSAVARVANGQLNAQEKASVNRAKEALSRYEIHWEL